MTWFSNLKTTYKLTVFYGLVLVLLGVTAWEGLSAAHAVKQNQELAYTVDLKSMAFVKHIGATLERMSSHARDAMLQTDPAQKEAFARKFEASDKELRDLFAQADIVGDPTARALVKKLGDGPVPGYIALARDAIAASPRGTDPGDRARLLDDLAKMVQGSDTGRAALDAEGLRLWEQAGARAAAAKREYDRGLWTTGILFAVAAVVGALFTRAVSRSIAVPLRATADGLGKVAQGDLTVRFDADRRDEVGEVASALNASLQSMCTALAEVAQVSDVVSAASGELATNAHAISSGAQSQAASLEETAASLEEISSTVKQNTDNAQEASSVATGARDVAERGGAVVASAVSAMGEITRSSKKIADIIATIDEIAFQTNLLALNAAVEAARAGEQGRGFAVVATEVRTLAQRTGAAAKEIRGLIADSTAKVEIGTQQVNESGKALEEIVGSVKQVTDMVAEIAAASREQLGGIDQVNSAVTQVDHVTQSSAAQTEELSVTARSLSEKAAQLQSLVSTFQVGGATRPGASSAARPTPARVPASAPRPQLSTAPRSLAPRPQLSTAPRSLAPRPQLSTAPRSLAPRAAPVTRRAPPPLPKRATAARPPVSVPPPSLSLSRPPAPGGASVPPRLSLVPAPSSSTSLVPRRSSGRPSGRPSLAPNSRGAKVVALSSRRPPKPDFEEF